jgi:hypothetical protein
MIFGVLQEMIGDPGKPTSIAHFAAEEGLKEALSLLLDRGVDPEAMDEVRY